MSWQNKLKGNNPGWGARPGKPAPPSGDQSPGAYSGYRDAFTMALKGTPKCTVYDIDILIECDSQLRSIFEYKRYNKVYQNKILVPYAQYICLKKMSMRLGVPAWLTVEQGQGRGPGSGEGSSFWVVRIDPSEYPADRPGEDMPGKKGLFAPWSPDEGAVLSWDDWADFLKEVAAGGFQ